MAVLVVVIQISNTTASDNSETKSGSHLFIVIFFVGVSKIFTNAPTPPFPDITYKPVAVKGFCQLMLKVNVSESRLSTSIALSN